MSNSKFVHYPWLTLGREVLKLKRALLGDETASAMLFMDMNMARSGGADIRWTAVSLLEIVTMNEMQLKLIVPCDRNYLFSSNLGMYAM